MSHCAFAIKIRDRVNLCFIQTLFPSATLIAFVVHMNYRQQPKIQGFIWLAQPRCLHEIRKQMPPHVTVDHQVMDYDDCRLLLYQGTLYGRHKLTPVDTPVVHGTWPSNEEFWLQRVKPGDWTADALLCHHDICKSDIGYNDLINRYFFLWCRCPAWIQTCYDMYHSSSSKSK